MFKQAMVRLGLKLVNSFFVEKIQFAPVKEFVQASLTPVERVAYAYLDKNPDDQAQIEQIWYEENDAFVAASFDSIEKIIAAKVEDPERRDVLIEIIKTIRPEVLELVEGPNR